MSEREKVGWIKHLDFIILDILCLNLAFVLAYGFRHGLKKPYGNAEYLNLAIVVTLLDFCIAIISGSFKNVLKRGIQKEFTATLRHVFLLEGLVLLYLFSTQRGKEYSRIFFYLMVSLYVVISVSVRAFWKNRLKRGRIHSPKVLLIIAPRARIEECIRNIVETQYSAYYSVCAVVTDADLKGQVIRNVPVVADSREMMDYIRREWVDEVFIPSNLREDYPGGLVEQLNKMGVIIHVSIAEADEFREHKQQIERFGKYTVVTTSLNYAGSTELLLKRMMDIAGGFLGCIITLILLIIFGPVIYISSPGPIFFAQERVGKNGKRFKMYKFRTMYPDAEERKKDLLEQNRVDGGRMFKLDFDPRIIGNRKLPDGTVKEGIGSFLRKTSLDEFPQMLNILRGDMSLVGTRPPTVDEWERYELHHRARLSFRPGLTGLWQVSGRSNITDFEEVVRLDTEYIENWSIGLDVMILLKTLKVVFRRDGAM